MTSLRSTKIYIFEFDLNENIFQTLNSWLEYCQCFTFKRCVKFKLECTSHGGMCSAHYFGKKIAYRQNSECCDADF